MRTFDKIILIKFTDARYTPDMKIKNLILRKNKYNNNN